MTDVSLAVQTLIRARLVASAEVTALVDADAILDRSGRPERFPCIIIGTGEAQLGDGWHDVFHDEVHADLHIWTAEQSTVEVKEIAGAIRKALRGFPWTVPGWLVSTLDVERQTFLRDPGGEHAHGVVSIRAVMLERAA